MRLIAVALFTLGSILLPTASQISIAQALDMYARGDREMAVAARPFDGLGVDVVLERLAGWLGPEPAADAPPDAVAAFRARGEVAARFAVDVVGSRSLRHTWFALPTTDRDFWNQKSDRMLFARLERPWPPRFPDEGATAPLVAWAIAFVPNTGEVEPWEPWWWLASIAILQASGEWQTLLGNDRVRYDGDSPPMWEQRVRDLTSQGFLAQASSRLGTSHPRVRLAEVVSRAAALTDASGRFTTGPRTTGPYISGRHDVLRNLEAGAGRINGGRFDEVETQLLDLMTEPGFEGEVALRVAQFRLLRRDWKPALEWLDRAEPVLDDGVLLAMVDYFRGWVFERTDRPSDALAAYRRAHARYPYSPNLNALLAAQLMVAGARTEAAEVLEVSMREEHNYGYRDLYSILVDGDGRLSPEYARHLREAR